MSRPFCFFFFFNDTATTEIYTLSLHDALPISSSACQYQSLSISGSEDSVSAWLVSHCSARCAVKCSIMVVDRKSTRLNSSHLVISYAVFCLKKKNGKKRISQKS